MSKKTIILIVSFSLFYVLSLVVICLYFNSRQSSITNNISTPTPIITQPIEPSPSVYIQDDSGILLIKKYYNYLSTNQLQQAYDMYSVKPVTFDKYKEWYQYLINVNVDNFEKIKENTYKFNVNLIEKNPNNSEDQKKKYWVTMSINNDKVITVSSIEVVSEDFFKNLHAYSIIKNNKYYLIISKDGNENIIATADNDWINKFNTSGNFSNVHFSPQGNYLTYFLGGWEYSGGRVYDIKNSHILTDISIPFPTFIEISKNEKYIVSCYESGMSGDYGAFVSSLPEYKIQYDFFKNSNFNVMRKCILTNGFEETYMCDSYKCKVNGDIAEFSVKSQESVRSEDKINLLLKFNLSTGQVVQ